MLRNANNQTVHDSRFNPAEYIRMDTFLVIKIKDQLAQRHYNIVIMTLA